MKQIHLKALNLKVHLPKNYYFRDDGFVPCVKKHCRQLMQPCSKFKWFKTWLKLTLRQAKGVCFDDEKNKAIIFYQKQANKIKELHIRAHEETHVLHQFGLLNHLEKLFKDNLSININLQNIKDGEVIADLGAIYTLLRNNYSLDEAQKYAEEYFTEAREIYEKRQKR